MFPASSKGSGSTLGFPDVCKTPILGVPVPAAYPIASLPSGAKSQLTKTKTQKEQGQKKAQDAQQDLAGELARAKAAFAKIEGSSANTLAYDPVALQNYARHMQAAIQKTQKLLGILYEAANNTVAHCETKRAAQNSVTPSQTKVLVGG